MVGSRRQRAGFAMALPCLPASESIETARRKNNEKIFGRQGAASQALIKKFVLTVKCWYDNTQTVLYYMGPCCTNGLAGSMGTRRCIALSWSRGGPDVVEGTPALLGLSLFNGSRRPRV